MKIKFIGVPGEDHASISQYGYTFPLGEPVEVESDVAVRKLSNHPHFVAGETAEAATTREELEAKAAELGIEFDKRLGDKKLAALIADKLSLA